MKLLGVLVIVITHLTLKANCQSNNVCKTFEDYNKLKENSNCWYDVAASGSATDIIQSYGYPLESYNVTTSDGYILSLYRIPNHNATVKRSPVFMQHGLLSSSANFLGKRNESLAFLLADAGYDVWLGNYRGTEFSEGHVNLTVFDKEYWNYSYDEISLIDIPAMLNKIQTTTGRKGDIIVIAHSLGTTVTLAYASTLPNEAKATVKLFILMAPAAPLPNMISPFRLVAPFAELILKTIQENGLTRVVSQAETLKTITRLFCLESPVIMKRCMEAVNLFYGPLNQMDPSTIPVFFNQFPAGTAIKVVRHAADLVLDRFGKYDFGLRNLEKYGIFAPPNYDVSVIQVPVFIMYAINDWACTKRDSLILYKRLSPAAKIYGMHEVNVEKFNHIDFLFGQNVKSIAYDRLIQLINRVD